MKAMILAGGLSTRLYPLTKQVPKPLVPVAGVPNAVHVARYLQAYGYDEIALNVHYLADPILEAFGDGSQFGVKLAYLHERELLGSAGAVKQMESFFGEETFVVIGCDELTDFPLDKLVAFHRERGAIATIGLVERERVEQYGVVVTDETGKITGFQEKPAPGAERSHSVNTGIYVFNPEIFTKIPAETFYDFGKQVFPELQQAGAEFYGYSSANAYWVDIGTPEEYIRATRDVLAKKIHIPNTRSSGTDPTATIAATARIEGDVWIGRNAKIGENTIITGPTVIGDNVRIEPNVKIEASIIWQNSTIGSNAKLKETIVGVDYIVPANKELTSAIVANNGFGMTTTTLLQQR